MDLFELHPVLVKTFTQVVTNLVDTALEAMQGQLQLARKVRVCAVVVVVFCSF